MNPFKNFDWSFKSIAKGFGALLLGVVALTILISLLGFSYRIVTNSGAVRGITQSLSMKSMNYAMDYDDGYAEEAIAERSYGGGIAPSMALNVSPTGSDAEDYEVREYNATIKTQKIDETCGVIAELKAKDYVIFENSDKNESYCYYRFKVNKENNEEILAIVQNLDPEYFNANIRTIKGSIEHYESEVEILNKKLESVEETLQNAQSAYDEISKIATQQRDAETLASIINNKLNLIEKLTNERLSIKERIDRYNKSKADQMDQLDYTFYNINVYKDALFDWEDIQKEWRSEFKQMIQEINQTFQGVSLGLVMYLFKFVQIAIFFLISLFLIKIIWAFTKKIWKGKRRN